MRPLTDDGEAHVTRRRYAVPTTATGYASRHYADSFGAGFVSVEAGGAWLLQRPIPGTVLSDASGCYPICCTDNWGELLASLPKDDAPWVSLSLVTDPFAEVSQAQLKSVFVDRCFLYKQHRICDLSGSLEKTVASHHRRNARKALEALTVVTEDNPVAFAADWTRLYDDLRLHHGITGHADFSGQQLRDQLAVPGASMLRAVHEGETVAAIVVYRQADRAYYHLGASSARGYSLRATFALFWTALTQLADAGVRWFSLGSSAGVHAAAADGLDRFKAGWCNTTRPVFFCGRIYQPEHYRRLTGARDTSGFFPAYRAAPSAVTERSASS